MNIATITTAKDMLADSKFFMGYSRWDETLGRYEDWDGSVERVMNMHRQKYAHVMTPELEGYIAFAEQAYKEKAVLGSQRALQFGGEQIFKHESRLYNCSASYVDRPRFFQEAMYLLLCGCGVGFSVQKQHVAKLPEIRAVSRKDSMVYTVPDSIEGWSDAFGVLLSSYFVGGGEFPEFEGKTVHFDVSQIRPRGAMISGGFKAPGPDGLVRSLEQCRKLLERETTYAGHTLTADLSEPNVHGERVTSNVRTEYHPIAMRSIVAYDFVMHMADAVLSGGIRRAACIALFGKDDEEMMMSKTGNWFEDNPQRGRSNNSVLVIRDQLTREEWATIMKRTKEFGEPGFIFADDTDALFNPCVEIGLRGYTEDMRSGFQKCNLTEQNGAFCTSREKLMYSAKAAAILGTLQAGYTNFSYLDKATADITEREALLGVSITGWMSNPEVLFNEDNMRDAAHLVRRTNVTVAALIGIRPAARATTAKPAGNASVLLGCASGIHGDHAKRYFRNVQMTNQDAVTQLIEKANPKMSELSRWNPSGTDVVISFPIVANEGSIFKSDLYGVKQLEYVKKAQEIWINEGRNPEHCVAPWLSHNISNTISVDDWAGVEQYIFDNRQFFAGISLLGTSGDRDYVQAPFTEVFTPEELLEMYGSATMFASGLIVDGCHAFADDLWRACSTALGNAAPLSADNSADLLKRDWVRRAVKFADNHFGGDKLKMTYCLKDVHNLHKWEAIVRVMEPIDFAVQLNKQVYTDVDTMGAIACHGGACEAPEWLTKAADAHDAAVAQ